jgi:FdhD protein
MSDCFFSYNPDGTLKPADLRVVQEYPLSLRVNDREIATLIASPHDLRFLVAGFLRLQGFVTSVDDFQLLSVCQDFGAANVRIKGVLPERLKPVLTSGCGTGISFSLPGGASPQLPQPPRTPFPPAVIFSLMQQLAKQAEQYKSHGGIHSAAVGRDGEMLLYAEDIGRHNTLDRIAGEALLKGIDLAGAMLVTSGRVSSEMVAKAALLGIALIASRTSPTDMAIRLCREQGICLVGYVRGGRFTVYALPERIEPHGEHPKLVGITGAILAGGRSSRMGQNKALLDVAGTPLIQLVYDRMSRLFAEVLLITNDPDAYSFLPCRTIPDIYPGAGSLAGVHAALVASGTDRVFTVACDMPWLSEALIRHLCTAATPEELITVPCGPEGLEPLHALYRKGCLPLMTQWLEGDRRCIYDLYPELPTKIVPWEEIAAIPDAAQSFRNINTHEDYQALVTDQQN